MNPNSIERVSIYIDGGNFYHLVLKKLNTDELSIDYEKFATFLAGTRVGLSRIKTNRV